MEKGVFYFHFKIKREHRVHFPELVGEWPTPSLTIGGRPDR